MTKKFILSILVAIGTLMFMAPKSEAGAHFGIYIGGPGYYDYGPYCGNPYWVSPYYGYGYYGYYRPYRHYYGYYGHHGYYGRYGRYGHGYYGHYHH